MTGKTSLLIGLLLVSGSLRLTAAGTGILETPDAVFWLGLPGAAREEITGIFGSGYIEIEPDAVGSSADTIIWYESGLTFWFTDNELSMVRADASAGGTVSGLRGGMSREDIERLFGTAWIESGESLYYNLPWNKGPLRLRFIFRNSGLEEIYLFRVR